MSYIMKFEALKRKAIRGYLESQQAAYHMGLMNGEGAVLALKFMQLGADERKEIIAFADAFRATPGDELAAAAKQHDPYALMALGAREDGIRSIERCDVRNASAIVERFPNVLPRRLRGKSFSAYVADNEAADWVLEFADPLSKAA
ncbi:MAG: hypothetical protein EPN36_03455 [Rhodanobacteraceae bacterium]|nr:MAG: hypothetical protein EPN36_03455 [Rhodanobacteraceae bacterium]